MNVKRFAWVLALGFGVASHSLPAGTPRSAVPGWLNPVRAGVDQVAPGVLQFWMELAEPPITDPDAGHGTTYVWFVDSDCNPATGQAHGALGSEYNIRAVVQNHVWEGTGHVDGIDGRPSCEAPMLVDGTKVFVLVTLDKIGNPPRFTWNCGTSAWNGSQKYLTEVNTFIPSALTLSDGQPSRVIIEPILMLRQGVSSVAPRVRAFNMKGSPLSLKDRRVTLFASPYRLKVVGQRVEAEADWAGRAKVTAMVDGVLSSNIAHMYVGTIEVVPAIMHLELSTRPVAKVSLRAADANGKPIPLQGHDVQLTNDFNDVAVLSPDGTVRALTSGAGRQTHIRAMFDGSLASNYCAVRVLRYPVPLLPEKEARGGNVSFWYPPLAMAPPVGCRFEEMVQQYDLAGTLDRAYLLLWDLTGTLPHVGGRQHLAAVCNDDKYRLTGGSGNPAGVGFDPLQPSSAVAFPDGSPKLGLMLHEIGHEFLSGFLSMHRILFDGRVKSGPSYGEATATLFGMYACQAITTRPDHCGVAPAAVVAIADPNGPASLASTRRSYVEGGLNTYLRNGAHYPDKFTPDVLDGMLLVLGDRYGWDIYRRFFSVFYPPDERIDFSPRNETDRATFFIAAMSAAARTDLRRVFGEWGLPCDNTLFQRLLPELTWRAAQRD